ncbi:manganase accumulation protein MntS [Atlantibacter hermannii]|nr:manganase accumulation protein MntS [Atlantibacter hermannii]MCZ7834513.1 manganase accumulation protein MntS [Atlantibacter hermannii]
MNEFKRCISVFSHSPFQVRLLLIDLLCDYFKRPEPKAPAK